MLAITCTYHKDYGVPLQVKTESLAPPNISRGDDDGGDDGSLSEGRFIAFYAMACG